MAFEQIPTNLRAPLTYIEINNHASGTGLAQPFQRVLVMGHASSVAPVSSVLRVYPGDSESLFGKGSMLAEMLTRFFAVNKTAEVWALPVAVPESAAPASGKIAITGAATVSGTLSLMIAGQRVQTGVLAGDTPDIVAGSLIAAVNTLKTLPVTAALVVPDPARSETPVEIKLTANWGGLTGNDIDLRLNYYPGEKLPAGISVTLTQLAGGTGSPELAAAIAAFGGMWFNRLINPFTDKASLDALALELLDRWGPLKMTDGIAFSAVRGNLGTTATFGETRNDFLFTTIGTGLAPEPPYIWAADNGAVVTASLAIDPARPLHTLALHVLPPAESDRWELTERNGLLYDGISTYTVSDSGVVQLERQITMYREDASGNPDDSYLDVNTIATLSHIRYVTNQRIRGKFPRHKLANDGTRFGPGQPIVTPSVIKTELLALFTELEYGGLVEGFSEYKTTLSVTRDPDNRTRVNVFSDQDIVNGFSIYAHAINYIG